MNTPHIHSDGRTVWINSGSRCVARFGRLAFEVFSSTGRFVSSGTSPACTLDALGDNDWERFRQAVAQHHDVIVGDEHRPAFLQDARADA